MEQEEFEFLLTRYLDGDLPPRQRAALEERLATDAAARAQLEQFRKLDAALRTAMPLPPIRWDALANQISSAIAAQSVPARNLRLPVRWIGVAAALAACVLLSFALTLHHPNGAAIPPASPPPAAIAQVFGPQVERPAGPTAADVTLGPAPQSASAAATYAIAADIVYHPSHVSITSFDAGGR